MWNFSIPGENPAAMQHGSHSTSCVPCPPLWFLAFFISLMIQILYFRFMSCHIDTQYHFFCRGESLSSSSSSKTRVGRLYDQHNHHYHPSVSSSLSKSESNSTRTEGYAKAKNVEVMPGESHRRSLLPTSIPLQTETEEEAGNGRALMLLRSTFVSSSRMTGEMVGGGDKPIVTTSSSRNYLHHYKPLRSDDGSSFYHHPSIMEGCTVRWAT
jgi:hypothetical protein